MTTTVREFNGTTDALITAIGGLSGMTHGTMAAIVKPAGAAAANAIMTLVNSAGSTSQGGLGFSLSGATVGWYWDHIGSGAVWAEAEIEAGTWYVVVIRKETGTNTPRVSYKALGGAWTHVDASAARSNWASVGASGSVRTVFRDSSTDHDHLNGRLAVRAAWSNALPWAADATGDAAIEAAGLETTLAAWASAGPSALWAFNQASTATAIEDLIGTADQSGLTGTTVVSDTDLTFNYGGEVAVTGSAPLGGLTAAVTLDRLVSLAGAAALGALAATGALGRSVGLSGAAPLPGLTAVGSIERAVSVSGAATLGGLTAGGSIERAVAVSGAATLGGLSATGVLTMGPAVSLTGSAPLGGLTATGVITAGGVALSLRIGGQLTASGLRGAVRINGASVAFG